MKNLLALLMLAMSSAVFAQMPPPDSVGPGVSQDLAVWRAAHYSDVRYKLNLTLEKMSPVLKGTIEIRVKVGAGTLSPSARSVDLLPIILDWRKIRGHEDASIISNVSLNGTSIRSAGPVSPSNRDGYFEDFSEHLIFRNGVVPGENVIKLDFTSPILTSGSAITRYIDKEDGSEYIYSLFVPSDASTAFPAFDQPDLKAKFQLSVSVPTKWKVVSNSAEKDTHSLFEGPPAEGETTGKIVREGFYFQETGPISTYLFAFAAGEFTEFLGERSKADVVGMIDVRNDSLADRAVAISRASSTNIYVRKSQAEKFKPHAAETFRLMREGVKYLEGYFDYKFPWPKYDLVLIPEFPFGGMEHAGATFVREQSIIFPTEPTKSDYINRATLIFHETAHQWFGDTVTMKWFDDLWLKEGFANFMAYKAMEKIMPETNAWKVFYERIKQPAYATDSTKGTTAIYQPIKNLSAAKSAYGNIVYNKAPAFLRQAEFYLGEDKFQTAVRAFLKKHEYANATWEDLVKEFEEASNQNLEDWSKQWVTRAGLPTIRMQRQNTRRFCMASAPSQNSTQWPVKLVVLQVEDDYRNTVEVELDARRQVGAGHTQCLATNRDPDNPQLVFPNYQDYGYGIFLLDDKSRDYVLKNVQNEKDPFLRSMMYGALWDSVREGELDPKEYVELVIKNLPTESDENIVASILGRASTAMNYYIADERVGSPRVSKGTTKPASSDAPSLTVGLPTRADMRTRLENLLIDRVQNAPTLGQKITFYRAFLNIAASENARKVLKMMLKAEPSASADGFLNSGGTKNPPAYAGGSASAATENARAIPLKTKDKFDIVTRIAILGDPEAAKLLADLEKTETSDDAKRYAYAAHAAFATKENREKFWNDFINNKQISESWIEAAMGPFNSIRHDDLSLPYLQRALAELPSLKRDRKIFFVNGWLGAFIGGQKSQQALEIVNKFLADDPNLDNDLRLKILENVDVIERAVKIRTKNGRR